MRFFYHPGYVAPLPAGHRFPMSKYETTRNALSNTGIAFETPVEIPRAAILLAHETGYADAVINAAVSPEIERRIGFPVTPLVSLRSRLSVGGTLAAAEAALEDGFAANLAGGSHHAMPGGGAGYCVLNDLAIAAAYLLQSGRVKRLMVIDLDVHQGDGTAICLQGREGAYTFSIHAERNFPARKARSDMDIALPDGTNDASYLAALESGLAQAFDEGRPDLVLVQAGVDPHVDDRLGRLALSDEGLCRRDTIVREKCIRLGIPFAATLGGGYDEDVAKLGARHAESLLCLAGMRAP